MCTKIKIILRFVFVIFWKITKISKIKKLHVKLVFLSHYKWMILNRRKKKSRPCSALLSYIYRFLLMFSMQLLYTINPINRIIWRACMFQRESHPFILLFHSVIHIFLSFRKIGFNWASVYNIHEWIKLLKYISIDCISI